MTKIGAIILGAISIACLPLTLFAQVMISEIMYDEKGSDDGREWIEIKNVGEAPILVSELKFFEGETNHGITPIAGINLINQGECAIISSNPAKFRNDHNNFSGNLFKASFSLNNTGEFLALKKENSVEDSIVYGNSWGAKGDGQSLHRNSLTTFEGGSATPGICGQFSIPYVPTKKITDPSETKTVAPSAEDAPTVVPKNYAKKSQSVLSDNSSTKNKDEFSNEEKIKRSENTFSSTTVIYTASSANSGFNYDWLWGLFGIVAVGSIGVLFSGLQRESGFESAKDGESNAPSDLSARDFEIIELKDRDEK